MQSLENNKMEAQIFLFLVWDTDLKRTWKFNYIWKEVVKMYQVIKESLKVMFYLWMPNLIYIYWGLKLIFFFFFPTGVYDQKHWKTTGLMSFFLTDIYILTGLLADNFSTQKTVRLQF